LEQETVKFWSDPNFDRILEYYFVSFVTMWNSALFYFHSLRGSTIKWAETRPQCSSVVPII